MAKGRFYFYEYAKRSFFSMLKGRRKYAKRSFFKIKESLNCAVFKLLASLIDNSINSINI